MPDTNPAPIGPISGQKLPRYAGHATFARLPRIEDVTNPKIGIIGAPFDSAVTYRPGARFGPSFIRQASRVLRTYNPALDIDPFKVTQVADLGDIECNPFSITETVETVDATASEYMRGGMKLVALGGDHSIALPMLRAAAKVHGPVAVVHFDAHLDTWDTYFGERLTHGSPFRRASEEGLIVKGASVHIGTRGPIYSESDLTADRNLGFTPIHIQEFHRKSIDEITNTIHQLIGEHPVYISVDIDVLDPAFAPGTGTPEPGGMTSRELLEILRSFASANVVSADVVEVAPAYDHAEVTALAASSVVYELISIMVRNDQTRTPSDDGGAP